MDGTKKPNKKLQHERELRGWSQSYVAEKIGAVEKTVSRWECGEQKPGPHYRRKLCKLFEKNAEELGFLILSEKTQLPQTTPPITTIITPVSSLNSIEMMPSQKKTIARIDETGAYTPYLSYKGARELSEVTLLSRAIGALPSGMLPADSATWFSEKLVEIVLIVNQWHRPGEFCTDLQQLLDMEFKMFDEVLPFYDPDEFQLSRRNALLVIAALPKGLLGVLPQSQKVERTPEEVLPACAASITACWHLMKGKDITSVERALSRYFSFLLNWSRQSFKQQRIAAYFAAQSCMLMGLVELHRSHYPAWLSYSTQAVEYAKISRDRTLHVYALVFQGSAYKENKKLGTMLETYQEAARYLGEVMPLVRSKVLAELARSYARNGYVQEALECIDKARAVFPGEDGNQDVPCFVSADCGIFQLILLDGLTHLDLGEYQSERKYYQKAWDALAQVEKIPATILIPDRLRLEITNQRALASVKIGNLEMFRECLIEGVNGAKALGSEKRRQEVRTTYREARLKWPKESQILELADLLV